MSGYIPDEPGTLGVVDIGSNSARMVVLRATPPGHFELIEDEGASLRLVRAIDDDGRFEARAIDRTIRVMREFQAIAQCAGASRTIGIATSAVREALNGPDLLERLRNELGIEATIITGEQEAHYALQGAVHSLPVEGGVLIDQGGGSLQMIGFAERRQTNCWTSPLGALRLNGKFLRSDPPARPEQDELLDHVERYLAEAPIQRVRRGEQLVGTGGTIRTLARIDRRAHKYPVSRLHGYVLRRERLAAITTQLADADAVERAEIPGLNEERVDSIVAGALVWRTMLERLGAHDVLVSGQGLREGVAMEQLDIPVGSAIEVRAAAIDALCRRFSTWDEGTASRRARLARELLLRVEPSATPDHVELVQHAATVLDIGRSMDFYNRHEHTAAVLTATDIAGFSHRPLALLAAVIERAGGRKAIKAYSPLVTKSDEPVVARYGGILSQADEEQRRCPDRRAGD